MRIIFTYIFTQNKNIHSKKRRVAHTHTHTHASLIQRTTNKQISQQRRLTVSIFTRIRGNALQIKTFLLDRICQCTRLIGTPKMRVALKSTTSVCKSCLRINEKDAGKSKLMSCLKKLFISDEMCTYKCCHEYV